MSVVVRNLQRRIPVDVQLLRSQVRYLPILLEPLKPSLADFRQSRVLTFCSYVRQATCIRDAVNGGEFASYDVALYLTSDARIRALNSRYAGIRAATDVLSFRLADERPLRSPLRGRGQRVSFPSVSELENAPFLDPDTGCLAPPNARAQRVVELPRDLGTVFMSVESCRRIAAQRAMHYQHYMALAATHSLAHLVGHTHEHEHDYAAMKREEMVALLAMREQGLLPSPALKVGRDCRAHDVEYGVPQSYLP